MEHGLDGARVAERPLRLLTVGSLPPEWGGPLRGGAATFHAALLGKLLAGEHGVEVVGVIPPGPLDREIPVPALVRPEGVLRASFYEGTLDRLRPDLVLMNHIAHTIGATHTRLGSPVPAVGVVQSWHNITFRLDQERRQACELTQEALQGLAAMVAVSHHTMEEGRQLGLEYRGRAQTIHNPVPAPYMSNDVDVTGHERSGALFLGSLIPRKRPGALVRAAARLHSLTVSIAGEGELEAELRDEILALGIEDRVRLAKPPPGDGHVSWVRDALLRAELLCLPSSSEGLPLAFVEALACGTPIVGFGPAVREIREEVGIELGEPLESGTADEIAAAVERVRARRWDRQLLRRATLDALGLRRVVDRYVGLFEGLLPHAVSR